MHQNVSRIPLLPGALAEPQKGKLMTKSSMYILIIDPTGSHSLRSEYCDLRIQLFVTRLSPWRHWNVMLCICVD